MQKNISSRILSHQIFKNTLEQKVLKPLINFMTNSSFVLNIQYFHGICRGGVRNLRRLMKKECVLAFSFLFSFFNVVNLLNH